MKKRIDIKYIIDISPANDYQSSTIESVLDNLLETYKNYYSGDNRGQFANKNNKFTYLKTKNIN